MASNTGDDPQLPYMKNKTVPEQTSGESHHSFPFSNPINVDIETESMDIDGKTADLFNYE
jgi:hypothetical protein